MNKTIQVNIGGRVFIIEEVAFGKLQDYLGAIRAYFANREGAGEIVNDIELRLAELFQERLTDGKQVITESDVVEVQTIMGSIEDYMDAEYEEETTRHSSTESKSDRRFFRDPDDKVVFGVCSGISHYFGWDPLVLRLVTVASVIFFGTGILLYILLAIIVPKAKTTAEKLQMRGKPVTVENISRKVKETMADMQEDLSGIGRRAAGNSSRANSALQGLGKFLSDLAGYLVQALLFVMRILGKVLGVAFTLWGLASLVFCIFLLFGVETWLMQKSMHGFWIGDGLSQLHVVFQNPDFNKVTFYIGLGLTTILPSLAIVLLGFRLLFGFRQFNIWLAVTGTVLWFVGITLLLVSVQKSITDWQFEASYSERAPVALTAADTLYIDLFTPVNGYRSRHVFSSTENYHDAGVTIPGVDATNLHNRGTVRFTAEMNRTGNAFELMIDRSAKGANDSDALANASLSFTNATAVGDSLLIFPFLALSDSAKIRDQRILYRLQIPLGKTVYFGANTSDMLDDVPNVTYTYDRNMVNHYWLMTRNGLICTDCAETYKEPETINATDSIEIEILRP